MDSDRFVDDILAVRNVPEVRLHISLPHQTRGDTFRFIAEQRQKYCAACSYARRGLSERLRFGSLPPAPFDQRLTGARTTKSRFRAAPRCAKCFRAPRSVEGRQGKIAKRLRIRVSLRSRD